MKGAMVRSALGRSGRKQRQKRERTGAGGLPRPVRSACEEGTSRCFTPWQTWQRPTLPRLKTKYHRRRGVSRPSSEWDRVQPPRYNHQVSKEVRQTGLQGLQAILTPIFTRTPVVRGGLRTMPSVGPVSVRPPDADAWRVVPDQM